MSAAQGAGSEKLLTPANVITLVRICLVPVFVAVLMSPWPEWIGLPDITESVKRIIAAGVFILISATDWLDGYLARSRDEVTDFGKFMDPLADKILVVAALMALIELGSLPSWVALIIVAREFIVSGVRMVAASKGEVIAASWYGKFKTVFQMIAIVLFVVKTDRGYDPANAVLFAVSDGNLEVAQHVLANDWLWLASWGVMFVALVLTIVSMLDYIRKARHLIGLGHLGRRKGRAAGEGARAVYDAYKAQEAVKELTVSDTRAQLFADGAVKNLTESELHDQAARVLETARAAGCTLGTAESLTGGLIVGALTAVPGSSDVMRGGVVSYAVGVKEDVLGVSAATIAGAGVVSEDTARAMAAGARAQLSCDVAVAVTGIAGPGGAEPGKPVGTVCLACASPVATVARTCTFSGDRAAVRAQTVAEALAMLETACKETAK